MLYPRRSNALYPQFKQIPSKICFQDSFKTDNNKKEEIRPARKQAITSCITYQSPSRSSANESGEIPSNCKKILGESTPKIRPQMTSTLGITTNITRKHE